MKTIVDIHAHLWQTRIGGRTYFSDEAIEGWASNFGLGAEVPIDTDGAMLIEALDRAEDRLDIDEYKICVFAIDLRPLFAMDVPLADLNDWVIRQAARDPRGRILPFACMNPLEPDACAEVRRCTDLGVRGFKLYPPTGFYPDDPAAFGFYEAVLEAQRESGRVLPVMVHQGFSYSGSRYAQPVRLEEVAFRFGPDIRLIAAHVGIPWTDEALWLSAIHPNVYVDIALFGDVVGFWPQLHAELFAKAKRARVIERVLFGTDWPLSALWLTGEDPAWANLHRVASAVQAVTISEAMFAAGYPEIGQTDIDGILGKNAARLFEMD